MKRQRSMLYRIDMFVTLAECTSKMMHAWNMELLTETSPRRMAFLRRMAAIKQHQVERLTRIIKAAFDKAKGANLDDLTATGPRMKTVTLEVEAA